MKRTLPLILILGGLMTTVFGIKAWVDQTPESLPAGIHIPEKLAGLPLTTSQVGTTALDELARLHGRILLVDTARSGVYGADGQIQLWVARAEAPPAASQLVAAMAASIAERRSPFTPLGESRYGDRVVHELAGLGQRHYYFQSADLLVWLAADDRHADQALQQVLAFYR